MNIPLQFTCTSCGKLNLYRIHLDQTSFDWICKNCGHLHPSLLDLDFTVGFKLLQRSLFELKVEKDYSMSIVFSAIALDSELSRLFFKWTRISAWQSGHEFDEEACEKSMLKLHNFMAKMTGVSELLWAGGIEAFVASSAQFSNELKSFPSLNPGSLVIDFHRMVFKPRNKILHQGLVSFQEEDANRAWSIANLGLRILLAMDHEKRATLK